jgi:TonB family protein
MAWSVHFQGVGFVSKKVRVSMGLKRRLFAFGLTLLLAGPVLVAPMASGQEAASDAVTRKIRERVTPDYPELAKQMGILGKVRIVVTITAEGRVTNTQAVGGNPLLLAAAGDALKKWRFEPAHKETTEVIEFEFGGTN